MRFLGGTDDYSLKNVLAAEAAGLSTVEFVERHADRWVRVKSPAAAALRAAAASQGAQISAIDATTIELRGITPAEVGELAARAGIVLHELSPQTGSLEDAFLQATATAQQFASQPVREPS